MKRSFPLHTLRFRIMAIAALCWLLPTLVLGMYMGGVFFDALKQKTQALLETGAYHAHIMSVQEIERIINKSKDATYDGTLESAASGYHAGKLKYQDYFQICRLYLDQRYSREATTHFTAYYTLAEPEKIIYTMHGESSVEEFRANAQSYALSIVESLDTRCRFIYVNGQVYLVRNLLNRRLEPFGQLIMNIRPEVLLSAYEKQAGDLGDVDICLDEYSYNSGDSFTLDTSDLTLGFSQDEHHLFYTQQNRTLDYTLTSMYKPAKRIIYAQNDQYRTLMLLLLLMLLPLEALIMYFVHTQLTQPLTRLVTASSKLQRGELGATVPVTGLDEISQTGIAFNEMSLQIKNLIEKSYREEIYLRDARIEALQSRVNPHFLNNALEIMNWQARMEGNEQISAMIEALSVLLNAGLDRYGDRLVTLSEEFKIADAYFYFLDQRFGAKLSVQKEIDFALDNILVPRLVIQTLLENAIEHGIAPAGGGWVRLCIYRQYAHMCIDVINGGRRLRPEDTDRISKLLKEDDSDLHAEHVGLRNIKERLRLIYDDKASLCVMPDTHGDTLARVTLPLEEESEGE